MNIAALVVVLAVALVPGGGRPRYHCSQSYPHLSHVATCHRPRRGRCAWFTSGLVASCTEVLQAARALVPPISQLGLPAPSVCASPCRAAVAGFHRHGLWLQTAPGSRRLTTGVFVSQVMPQRPPRRGRLAGHTPRLMRAWATPWLTNTTACITYSPSTMASAPFRPAVSCQPSCLLVHHPVWCQALLSPPRSSCRQS